MSASSTNPQDRLPARAWQEDTAYSCGCWERQNGEACSLQTSGPGGLRRQELSVTPEGSCPARRHPPPHEVLHTFLPFSFLSPLGPMVFLKEGGISCWVGMVLVTQRSVEITSSTGPDRNGGHGGGGQEVFFQGRSKASAFWVVMIPLKRKSKKRTFNRSGRCKIKALIFFNYAIRIHTFVGVWKTGHLCGPAMFLL